MYDQLPAPRLRSHHSCECCSGRASTVIPELCDRCFDALFIGHAPHPELHEASQTQMYAWGIQSWRLR